MADTFTTRLTLTKPEVGASTDTWGTKLNANFDSVDGLFDAGPALKLVNGGTGATSAGAARTNLGLGSMATQAADAVAITGGSATLTGALTLSDTQPKMFFYESDAETNEKYWRVLTTEGQFAIQPFDDSLSSGSNAVVIARTGTTVDSITLTATTVAVSGALTVNGDAVYHTGNLPQITDTSGSFEATLTSTPGGAALASGTAYWKRVGNIVSVRFPPLLATTSSSSLNVDSIPAEIRPSLSGTYVQTIPVVGRRNGSTDIVGLQILEDSSWWSIVGLLGSFDGSTSSKGIGAASNVGPSITYQVAD